MRLSRYSPAAALLATLLVAVLAAARADAHCPRCPDYRFNADCYFDPVQDGYWLCLRACENELCTEWVCKNACPCATMTLEECGTSGDPNSTDPVPILPKPRQGRMTQPVSEDGVTYEVLMLRPAGEGSRQPIRMAPMTHRGRVGETGFEDILRDLRRSASALGELEIQQAFFMVTRAETPVAVVDDRGNGIVCRVQARGGVGRLSLSGATSWRPQGAIERAVLSADDWFAARLDVGGEDRIALVRIAVLDREGRSPRGDLSQAQRSFGEAMRMANLPLRISRVTSLVMDADAIPD